MLEKTDWTKIDNKDPNKLLGVRLELNLMLRTGRADEVGKTLAEQETLKDELGVDPDTGLPAYEWLRVQTAAATGDYAEADRWLEAIREKVGGSAALAETLRQLGWMWDDPAVAAGAKAPTLAALLVGHLVLREALREGPSAVGAVWLLPDTRAALLGATAGEIAGITGLQCDLEAVRGWLSLEAGRTVEAPPPVHRGRGPRRARIGPLPRPAADADLPGMAGLVSITATGPNTPTRRRARDQVRTVSLACARVGVFGPTLLCPPERRQPSRQERADPAQRHPASLRRGGLAARPPP